MADFNQKENHGSGGKKSDQLNLFLNRRRRLLGLVIFFAILLLGFYFLVYPRLRTARETAQAALPSALAELAALDNYEQSLGELEKLVGGFNSQYKKELSDLSEVLPNKAQVPELIAQLDALLQKNGFKMTALDITETTLEKKATNRKAVSEERGEELLTEEGAAGPVAEEAAGQKGLKPLNISLKVVGSDYPAFKILLDKIEKHIRLLDVVSVDFAAQAEKSGEYDLNLRTYYFSS